MLDRFPQRDFGLWVFMCTTNVSLFCVYSVTIYIARAITPRAITPLPPLPGYHAEGYHAPYLPHGLSHACVYIPVTTPELSRSTTQVHRVITPAIVVRICSFHFTGFYATSSPPTPPPGATRYNLLHTGRLPFSIAKPLSRYCVPRTGK